MDIEEWVSEGKTQKFCPFYAVRNLINQANLVLMPFELLMDPKYLDLMESHFENSIVVVEDSDLFEGYILDVSHDQTEQISSCHSFDAFCC